MVYLAARSVGSSGDLRERAIISLPSARQREVEIGHTPSKAVVPSSEVNAAGRHKLRGLEVVNRKKEFQPAILVFAVQASLAQRRRRGQEEGVLSRLRPLARGIDTLHVDSLACPQLLLLHLINLVPTEFRLNLCTPATAVR